MRWLRVLALQIIAILVLLEIALITLDPYLFKGYLQYHPEFGFQVRPYAMGSNAFGFNDVDYPLERVPGVPRVLILGDSYGWSGGRECNYTALLEQRLNQQGHADMEVINAGYHMTGPLEQLKIFRTYAVQYNPDVLILAFFAGNDFTDSDPNRRRVVFNGMFKDISPHQDRGVGGIRLFPFWRAYEIARRYHDVRTALSAGVSHDDVGTPCDFPDRPSLTPEAFEDIEKHRLYFHRVQSDGTHVCPERIAAALGAVGELHRVMRDRGGDLLVAILPAEIQVDDQLFTHIVEDVLGAKLTDYERDRPQRILREFLAQQRIPFIDLLEEFQRRGRTRRLYNERETYWNLAGNQLAAELLQPFVSQHLAARAERGGAADDRPVP